MKTLNSVPVVNCRCGSEYSSSVDVAAITHRTPPGSPAKGAVSVNRLNFANWRSLGIHLEVESSDQVDLTYEIVTSNVFVHYDRQATPTYRCRT